MSPKKRNPQKALKLEAKGEALMAKGSIKRALKKFRKAIEYDPERESIYDKLVKAKDMLPVNWDLEDFIESLDWTMKKQERENPCLRQVHARLSPEWEKARELVIMIVATADPQKRSKLIEDLVLTGEAGLRAAIDLLVEINEAASQTTKTTEPDTQKSSDEN
jgi:tetratricopeptide (TPR) repeat protein